MPHLEVDVRDRVIEETLGGAFLEAAAWLQQLLAGAIDRSYQAAAQTQLTIGDRTFTTRATQARMADGDLIVDLKLTVTTAAR
jgi:hypothetical protein